MKSRLRRPLLPVAGLLACGLLLAHAVHADDERPPHRLEQSALPVTHGVAAGDVRAHSAVIWSRTRAAGWMHVQLWQDGDEGREPRHGAIRVGPERDFTGKVRMDGLRADTDYAYRVWFSRHRHARRAPVEAQHGRFHTAPQAGRATAVNFAWGGDLAGQNVCRDAGEGFPIFDTLNAMPLDFFIGLGDMIYADGTCEATGRYGNEQVPGDFGKSADMASYWAHWKYNREDAAYQRLLASLPYFAIWDDHEVVNDFGPLHDTRDAPPYTPGAHLLPLGLRAFLDYNPVAEPQDRPRRLYRSLRWGKHLEIFVLDTRQYRDANGENDDPTLKKTLLGREQLTWLKERLKASDATWKVIVSSVPISIPTGYPPQNGRDGWSNFDQQTGFKQELLDIFRFLRDQRIHNNLWITTDVHFAEVFRYTPFADTPDFKVHEFITGPLNAGLFPNRDYDQTLGAERLFFYGPESSSVQDYAAARQWMNFGNIRIGRDGTLEAAVYDVDGHRRFQQTLYPHPGD